MIYNFSYQPSFVDRRDVIQYLTEKKFSKVLDIGFSVNTWSAEFTTHYVDIKASPQHKAIPFIGNISMYDVWEQVINYVNDNGKFDFAICTHTLEDISSPQLVCGLLPRIAKEGYIAVPSKYMELSRHEGYSPCAGYVGGCGGYRGWVHHRWIFNKEGNEFVAYPKLPLTEYIDLSAMENRTEQDLRFFWKDSFELKVVSNDWLGPTDAAVRDLYKIAFLKD